MATTVTVEDPEMVEKKQVKDDGRVYLGKSHAGKHVQIVVTEQDKNGVEDTDAGTAEDN